MRWFDDHQLMAVSNSAHPRPAKCSRSMRSRAAGTSSGSAQLEVARRDALERRREQEQDEARGRGPVDRAGSGAVARTGEGCRCRARWASTWDGGTRLSLGGDDNRYARAETHAPDGFQTRLVTMAMIALGAALSARAAHAVDCVTTKGKPAFTTCRVDVSRETLRLFYADAQGTRYESFERLRAALARERKKLVFAMNAGMFHADSKPVGSPGDRRARDRGYQSIVSQREFLSSAQRCFPDRRHGSARARHRMSIGISRPLTRLSRGRCCCIAA